MSESELPPIPLDDAALDAVEHALGAQLTYEAEDGSTLDEPRVVGADYQLDHLLTFWSGHSRDDHGTLVGYTGGSGAMGMFGEGVPIYQLDGPRYSERDLLRALIGEVRRLRGTP